MYLWHYQVKNMTKKVVILLLCSQVTTVFSSHHCGDGGGTFSVLDLKHRSFSLFFQHVGNTFHFYLSFSNFCFSSFLFFFIQQFEQQAQTFESFEQTQHVQNKTTPN